MKKTKRILCALLAVMLILPMALVSVNAASTYESVEDLGWTVNTTNGLYSNPGAVATEIVDDFGETGNKALHFVGTTSAWNGYNIVSADAMAGVTQYTAKVTVCYTGAAKLGFHLNSSDLNSSKGDWASIEWTSTLENRTHTGSAWENAANVAGVVSGNIATITAKVNLDTQTITVTYSDGVNADVTSTRTTNTTETGAVVFAVRQLNAYVDDIVITNDATGAVIYSEDFEGFTVEAEEETTGLPAGTVLYQNNYEDGNVYASNTLTAADLGFRETTTGNWSGKDKLRYGAVAPVDGSSGAALLLAGIGGLANVEFFSADKMQAANAAEPFTKYVISADITMVDSGSGAWYGMSYSYDDGTEENAETAIGGSTMVILAWRDYQDLGAQVYKNGSGGTGTSWNNIKTKGVTANIGETRTWQVEIDTAAGTMNLYVGGILVQSLTDDQFKTYGAVTMMSCYSAAVWDNLAITRGTVAEPGTAIYTNNFDQLAEGRKLVPVTLNHTSGKVSTYTFTYAGVVTDSGDNSLHISSNIKSAATWNEGYGVELVPAEAVKNVEKYTIRMNLKLMNNYSTSVWMPYGAGNTHRIRIGLYGSGYFLGSNIDSFAQWEELSSANLGKYVPIVIELDSKSGVGKVFIEGTDYSKGITSDSVLGAINLVVGRGQDVYVDDVVVTVGTAADEPATYIGAQETAVDNGTYNVRFVASLGNQFEYTDYENVGLKITCGNKTWDTPCRYVYDSVTGGENVGNLETYSASTYGAKYLMAYTIKGIPADAGELTFTVTPYFETEAGTAYGTSYNVVYNQGAFVSSTIAH